MKAARGLAPLGALLFVVVLGGPEQPDCIPNPQPTPIVCGDSIDCEGLPHELCDGEWTCKGGGCVWLCDDVNLCKDFVQPGCTDSGCDPGFVCDTSVGCVPSVCSCDPATGQVICTADCGGGTCVPLLGKTGIAGGGSSFGMCVGACKNDLTLDGAAAQVVAQGWDGTVYWDNSGTLTAEGVSQSKALATALVGVNLKSVYGCPDCADGGASRIDLLRDGVATSHTYEFWKPPAELEDADAFLFQVIEDLASCTKSALIDPAPDCAPAQ